MNKSEIKVIGALKQEGRFASAQTLYQLLRKSGESTGLATVYRTLQKAAASTVRHVAFEYQVAQVQHRLHHLLRLTTHLHTR